MHGAALGAARQLERLLKDMDRQLPRRGWGGRSSNAIPRPSSFAVYGDPLDHFEFRYPAEWRLDGGASPLVHSPTLGLFVRVDHLPAEGEVLPHLKARFPGLTVKTWREGMPARADGLLSSANGAFTWTCAVFGLRGIRIALSTGCAKDNAPAHVRSYRRNILAAVRRHFKLAPGLRSK